MTPKENSQKVFKYFSEKKGNQHIAGQYAIEKILDLIDLNRPTRILEVGLGIGSISYAVLNYYKQKNLIISYDGTEENEFCLSQLEPNLGELYTQLNIYKNIQSIHTNKKYDLIIIDGSDESIGLIKGLISIRGVLFIEGHRAVQTNKMKEIFPNHKYSECVSDFKNPVYSPFPLENWSGGGQLIYTNPTAKQLLYLIKERLKTSFKYKIKRKIFDAKNKE